MNRKTLIIAVLAISLTLTSTAIAVLFFQQELTISLVSLDAPILVTDLSDVPISDLGTLSLYISQSESVYFRVHNNYDAAVDIAVSAIFEGVGFEMADSEIGIDIDSGGNYVGQPLDTPFNLPFGSIVDIGIAIAHVETAVAPDVTITLTAE